MSTFKFSALCAVLFSLCVCVFAQAQDEYDVWPDKAPGVKENLPDQMRDSGAFSFVTKPTIRVFVPEKKTSDACVILLPGGGYYVCGNDVWQAKYFADKGITCVLLKYRVPRPAKGTPIYWPAFQDAQRAIRLTRSLASKYGFNPDRIGGMGGSAGGHLTTLCCTSSSIQSYEPIDEIDKLPANLAFGIAKYPAYVLNDGLEGPNGPEKGNSASMSDAFKFDEKTCPMCFVHGDSDVYSPMGTIALYHKMRTMNIPCEIHIWAKAPHGFGQITDVNRDQVGFWLDAAWQWMNVMKLN